MDPGNMRGYLEKKFGEHLDEVSEAMQELGASYDRDDLAEEAYRLYEGSGRRYPKARKAGVRRMNSMS